MKSFRNIFKFSGKSNDEKRKRIPWSDKVESGLNLCIDHLDNTSLKEGVYDIEGNAKEVSALEKLVVSGGVTSKLLSQQKAVTISTCIMNIIAALDPPLLTQAMIPNIMEQHADIESLLARMQNPQGAMLEKFLTHVCDIVDSSMNETTNFHRFATFIGPDLFGNAGPPSDSGGRSSSGDQPSGNAKVEAVEKLLAFRSHVMHGRPTTTFDDMFSMRSYRQLSSISGSTRHSTPQVATPMSPPDDSADNTAGASAAGAVAQALQPQQGDEVIVDNILNRSVKISFPKKKKKGDSAAAEDHDAEDHETYIREILHGFTDVSNVCLPITCCVFPLL